METKKQEVVLVKGEVTKKEKVPTSALGVKISKKAIEEAQKVNLCLDGVGIQDETLRDIHKTQSKAVLYSGYVGFLLREKQTQIKKIN